MKEGLILSQVCIKGYAKKDGEYWILDMGNNEIEAGHMLDGIDMILQTFDLDLIKENDFITMIIERNKNII